MLDKLRKWSLTYDGGKNPIEFIERAEELCDLSNILRECLPRAMAELLQGRGLRWFCSNRSIWKDWPSFKEDFISMFFPHRYSDHLDDAIQPLNTPVSNVEAHPPVDAKTTTPRKRQQEDAPKATSSRAFTQVAAPQVTLWSTHSLVDAPQPTKTSQQLDGNYTQLQKALPSIFSLLYWIIFKVTILRLLP